MRQGWVILVWATVKFVLPLLVIYWVSLAYVRLVVPLATNLHYILAGILTVWAGFGWISAWRR